MYNWSVDTRQLKKNPRDYLVWKLENLINFGLGKEKLSKKDLLSNWKVLKIDEQKKNYLKYLLFGK